MDEDDSRTPDAGDPEGTPFDEFLRSFLGPEAGEEAARAMRAQGFDTEALSEVFPTRGHMDAALGQFRHLMATSTGPVNWQMATDMAKQRAYTSGDPSPTAAQAQRARQAMTVADLWLDAVTELAPGPLERKVWTRTQWIEGTLEVWKTICEPVAANVSRALSEALGNQFGSPIDEGGASLEDTSALGLPEDLPESMRALLGQTRQMMPRLASLVFASQIGNALTALAQEAMGSTDVGLPLADKGVTSLVIHNIEAFSDGLDIPFDEVLQYVAVRECAHQRLFNGVPWLAGDLVRAVEKYSSHIAIDTEEIARAAQTIDPSNPQSMEQALAGGVFASEHSPEQRAALVRLETLLALVEGWVEAVTTRATAPYLPHADQLREMMRRRRAFGGPAEQVLGSLIGLELRPRKARGAARLFELVEADKGVGGRDELWSHPHMIPTPEDLDSPDTFLVMRQAAADQDADIDAALASLLDGTMGWAEGLEPTTEPGSGSGTSDPDEGPESGNQD